MFYFNNTVEKSVDCIIKKYVVCSPSKDDYYQIRAKTSIFH